MVNKTLRPMYFVLIPFHITVICEKKSQQSKNAVLGGQDSSIVEKKIFSCIMKTKCMKD